ncbi:MULTISPECIES: glycine betaine/L-proline transporter ProP [Streptomyces]|uniref:glycine betaine/L-proline transporter ProP n=1 Tax=Streptomyces TaxID=1883 RepID=UPI0003A7D1A8|nr:MULTISPECIES: glycine betaine/L-proline transporter ProP [Streptomyces]MBZ6112088.1 glycine betaine/L-proline transporter ProP [Streptomyces olivaceus]MBZ6125456.1 glycine betaine/L-proline transporter ProP [Streptomyces olivaceus]MBZ6146424.1 glycine betaine/L-proline transporter ProP [Streptomyces olivaceus]MBZ6160575.1 glycine betaine/L-proline transporter ProP [Streptomyces olivaceus]MBZ6187823.1 glycine betaine/L-proline transporter ProP [Streptomyces olivaceus]
MSAATVAAHHSSDHPSASPSAHHGSARPTATDPALVRRAVKAAALGNAMEWFDFGVYSYIAVTLGKVFFPSGSPTAQLLSTFGAFAAAFLVRPLGGVVFGPLGDRVGRQKVLALTMIMMAAGTFAIGLIPSYATIGVWAPVLLLVARLVQGFSTGGEYAGASTFIAEYAPDKRRGFLGSWLEFGTLAGYIGGAGLVTLMTALLSDGDLMSWGWRIPFLIAGPMGVIGLYLRMRLEETPAFAAELEKAETARPKVPLREMVTGQWRALLLCVGLVLVFNVTDYMLLSYMPSYLTSELEYDETHGLLVVLAVMALMMVVQPFAGALTDRVGRRPVIAAGCAGFLLLSVPALLLIRQGSLAAVGLGLAALGLLLVCFTASMPSALPALFPTRVRYGSLSIGFNVSVSLFGGTTPLVVTALIGATGNMMMPAYYMMAAAVVGGAAVWYMTESAGRPLPGSPPSR